MCRCDRLPLYITLVNGRLHPGARRRRSCLSPTRYYSRTSLSGATYRIMGLFSDKFQHRGSCPSDPGNWSNTVGLDSARMAVGVRSCTSMPFSTLITEGACQRQGAAAIVDLYIVSICTEHPGGILQTFRNGLLKSWNLTVPRAWPRLSQLEGIGCLGNPPLED